MLALTTTGIAAAAVAIVDFALSFPPFLFFAIATALNLLFCGLGPALLSMIIAALASDFLFVQPRYQLSLNETTAGLAAVYGTCALFSRATIYWVGQRSRLR